MKVGEVWLCPRCDQEWLDRLKDGWLCSNCGFCLEVVKKEIPNDAA